MTTATLTPENEQRVDWRVRHIEWLLARIAGGEEDKEQFLAMFDQALKQAEYEGTMQAAGLLRDISAKTEKPASAGFFAARIEQLAALNLKS